MTTNRPRSGEVSLFSALRLTLYFGLLTLSLVGAYLYRLRTAGLFRCAAEGYARGHYLAYCQGNGYGDFDYGAFWFRLEPEAIAAAQRADVLFLGNSRMQFGFSTEAVEKFFAERQVPFYLLGFAYNGNWLFTRELLARDRHQARAYVINVDTFFDSVYTRPADAVLHDRGAHRRYITKQRWQPPHRLVCGAAPFLCGAGSAFFRLPGNGTWTADVRGIPPAPTVTDTVPDEPLIEAYSRAAIEFVGTLPVPRECIIFTVVPHERTRTVSHRRVAEAAGVRFIAPEVDGLMLFDGSHLDRPSAERWSAAFLQAAEPYLTPCLAAPARS